MTISSNGPAISNEILDDLKYIQVWSKAVTIGK